MFESIVMSTQLNTEFKLISPNEFNYQGALAGAASGLTKVLVGHPFDTIKVRLQTEGSKGRFRGPLHCLITTLKQEGVRGLYKGASPPLMCYALSDSLHIGTYTYVYIKLTHKNTKKNSYSSHALAGLIGGCVSTIVATPMERIKLRLQVQYVNSKQYSGAIDCVQQLVRSHGLRLGLWTGFLPTLILRSHFAILWPTYHYTSFNLENKFPQLNKAIPFLSGGLASSLFWLVAFPTDLVKNRILNQNNINQPPGMLKITSKVFQTEGWRGFYRGLFPTLLRSFPTNGMALLVYDYFIKH